MPGAFRGMVPNNLKDSQRFGELETIFSFLFYLIYTLISLAVGNIAEVGLQDWLKCAYGKGLCGSCTMHRQQHRRYEGVWVKLINGQTEWEHWQSRGSNTKWDEFREVRKSRVTLSLEGVTRRQNLMWEDGEPVERFRGGLVIKSTDKEDYLTVNAEMQNYD